MLGGLYYNRSLQYRTVLQCTTELIIIAPGYWCFVIQKGKLLVMLWYMVSQTLSLHLGSLLAHLCFKKTIGYKHYIMLGLALLITWWTMPGILMPNIKSFKMTDSCSSLQPWHILYRCKTVSNIQSRKLQYGAAR